MKVAEVLAAKAVETIIPDSITDWTSSVAEVLAAKAVETVCGAYGFVGQLVSRRGISR